MCPTIHFDTLHSICCPKKTPQIGISLSAIPPSPQQLEPRLSSRHLITAQDVPILVAEIIWQTAAEEQILAHIRVRDVDAQVTIRAAFASISCKAALGRAVVEFVCGADVIGVEIPLPSRYS